MLSVGACKKAAERSGRRCSTFGVEAYEELPGAGDTDEFVGCVWEGVSGEPWPKDSVTKGCVSSCERIAKGMRGRNGIPYMCRPPSEKYCFAPAELNEGTAAGEGRNMGALAVS